MNCPNCDKNINEKSAFCPYCGFNLKQQASSPDVAVDNARKTELAVFDNQNSQFHRRFGWLMFLVALIILGVSLAIYYGLRPKYYDITYNLNYGSQNILDYHNVNEYLGYNHKSYDYRYAGYEVLDLPYPRRSGYVFLGWYTSPDCEKETLFNEHKYQDTRADKDLVLYARWESRSGYYY